MGQWDDEDDEEWDGEEDEEPTIECPHCGEEVHEDSQRCPHCETYLSEEDAPPARKPWWIILGGPALPVHRLSLDRGMRKAAGSHPGSRGGEAVAQHPGM